MNGRELMEKRERCGMTQGQLAEYLGIGRTSVWRMETDEVVIPKSVEMSSDTLDPRNQVFMKWIGTLSNKQKLMVKRRQSKYVINSV